MAVDDYIKARSGESNFTSECADDGLLPTTQATQSIKDLRITDAQPCINIDLKFTAQISVKAA